MVVMVVGLPMGCGEMWGIGGRTMPVRRAILPLQTSSKLVAGVQSYCKSAQLLNSPIGFFAFLLPGLDE
jgi:hypothetical protein